LVVMDCQRKACRLSVSFIAGILPKLFHKIADIDYKHSNLRLNNEF